MKKIYIVLVRDHEGKCYEEWYFFFVEKSKQTALDKYTSGDKYIFKQQLHMLYAHKLEYKIKCHYQDPNQCT